MVVKGGTKILAIVTIIIMLVTIGFSGCVEEEKEKPYIWFHFEVEIFTENTTEIIIPIPTRGIHVLKYEKPIIEWLSHLVYNNSDLKIIGNINYSFVTVDINVSIPFGLKIETNDYCKIISHKEYDSEDEYINKGTLIEFKDLTLRNIDWASRYSPYYIYVNSTCHQIEINYKCYWDSTDYSDCGESSWKLRRYKLENGWQEVEFD